MFMGGLSSRVDTEGLTQAREVLDRRTCSIYHTSHVSITTQSATPPPPPPLRFLTSNQGYPFLCPVLP